jgi:uncharacterized protein YceK
MKTKSNLTLTIAVGISIASTLLLSACASIAQAQPSAGYIAEVDTSQVRVCFRSGVSPPAGQEVYFVSNAQTPRSSYRSMRAVGAARIIAAGSDGCATAIALTGKPRTDDDVYLSGVQPDDRTTTE